MLVCCPRLAVLGELGAGAFGAVVSVKHVAWLYCGLGESDVQGPAGFPSGSERGDVRAKDC